MKQYVIVIRDDDIVSEVEVGDKENAIGDIFETEDSPNLSKFFHEKYTRITQEEMMLNDVVIISYEDIEALSVAYPIDDEIAELVDRLNDAAEIYSAEAFYYTEEA